MSKYHAIKTEVDGFVFDSKREAARYSELKLAEMSGDITDLELQPKFPIVVNGEKICTYIADFRYKERDGTEIVEDCKGMKTAVYRLKKKLMRAVCGIVILET